MTTKAKADAPIVVLGSVNMDLVIRTPRMPVAGETVSGHDFRTIPGGKGANQAVAAARQGSMVAMVGRIGNDDFGRTQQRCLGDDGIDMSCLKVDHDLATGVAVITLDEAGENSIILSPEANGAVSVEQVEGASELISKASALICQMEVPLEAVTRGIEIAHHNNVPVVLNPAPAQPLQPSLLQKVDYLIPNETEASILTGIEVKDVESAKTAAIQLQKLGVHTVLVTLGEKGVVVADGEHPPTHTDSLQVEVVDTTAAGDTFVGTFSAGITGGRSVQDAVRLANHAAAIAVTRMGAQPSIPHCQEVEKFMAGRT